ncbi:hypothetical protein ABID59_007266 [Bradyrhizobium sp. S3.3.6]
MRNSRAFRSGPEHLFDEAKVVRLVSTIREINDSAVA